MSKSVKQLVLYSLVFVALLAWNANAGDGLWTTNYEQAKKDAARSGKSLLMDFSGSDWCGWCIRLDKEVFSHDVFKKAVVKDFVPVLLDYPNDKSKIPAEVQAQNQKLQVEYDIKGYPTIILADAQGRPYAQTGYQAGGPEAYLKHLADLRQKGTAVAQYLKQAEAPGLKPIDQASLLDKAVADLDLPVLLKFYGDVVDKIMALDKDNQAGLKKKYELRMRAAQAEQVLAQGDAAKAIELYEAIIRDFKPEGEQAQALHFSLADAYFASGQKAKAKAGLEKSLQAAPETQMAARIKMILQQYFPEPAKQ